MDVKKRYAVGGQAHYFVRIVFKTILLKQMTEKTAFKVGIKWQIIYFSLFLKFNKMNFHIKKQ